MASMGADMTEKGLSREGEGTVGGGSVRSSSTEGNIIVRRPHKKWDKKEEEIKQYEF